MRLVEEFSCLKKSTGIGKKRLLEAGAGAIMERQTEMTTQDLVSRQRAGFQGYRCRGAKRYVFEEAGVRGYRRFEQLKA